MPSTSFVVAISGIGGSGKTTLVKAVADRLGEAATLFADDFPGMRLDHNDFKGSPPFDFSRIRTPEFTQALRELGSGGSVLLPTLSESVGLDRSRRVDSARFLVVEECFGRLRTEIAGLLDFVVCIDTPLQVALARQMSRQFAWIERTAQRSELEPERLVQAFQLKAAQLKDYLLEQYAEWEHRALVDEIRQRRQTADLEVDGLQPVGMLAGEVKSAVEEAIRSH